MWQRWIRALKERSGGIKKLAAKAVPHRLALQTLIRFILSYFFFVQLHAVQGWVPSVHARRPSQS